MNLKKLLGIGSVAAVASITSSPDVEARINPETPERIAATEQVLSETVKSAGFRLKEMYHTGQVEIVNSNGEIIKFLINSGKVGVSSLDNFKRLTPVDIKVEAGLKDAKYSLEPKNFTNSEGIKVIFSDYAVSAIKVAGAKIVGQGVITGIPGGDAFFNNDPGEKGRVGKWYYKRFSSDPTLEGCLEGSDTKGSLFQRAFTLNLKTGESKEVLGDEVLKACQ